MSIHVNPDTTIKSTEALSRYTSFFIKEFQNNFAGERFLAVDYVVHESLSPFPGRKGEAITSQSPTKTDISPLTLHLYQPDLIGIPVLALQGWLDLELAGQTVKYRPVKNRFNFKRDILPLINAGGMAIQVMRYLVFHLEASLNQVMAVRVVLDMAHAQSLFYYYYQTINPSDEEKRSYKNLVPHHWTRAIFLCSKLKDHAAVTLLARQGVFIELKTFWWSCHDYFLPEDKRMMEDLTDISHRFEKMPVSDQLVAMFKTVKLHLLG